MFIFKAGPRKVFRLKPVRCAKKVADPCFKSFFIINVRTTNSMFKTVMTQKIRKTENSKEKNFEQNDSFECL